MADNRKELERAELHKTIWQIANDLRGSVDGWDFKQYVLGILFYRFISENITRYINQLQDEKGFDYSKVNDEDVTEEIKRDIIKEKGFFILPSELFSNVVANCESDVNLNVTLENIFKDIESSATGTDSERNFKGLFDDIDVNSKKLGNTVVNINKSLEKLLKAVANFNLGNYEEQTIDTFGDAYEYLMNMYAANAGKSGGEYFTPQEVSELLAEIALIDFNNKDENGIPKNKKVVNKVYDPACGSGSLLLKFAKILGSENVKEGFFGQEKNITTYNLCRINMFLHDINYEQFNIAHGDTLLEPYHWDDEPFEAIVSNPPYSIKWEGDSNPLLINDPRFSPAGVLAPKGKADLAFVMHILSWLSSNGTASIVEFPGILYRGGAEQIIRKYLVDNNFIDTVIQLPSDLFFGNTISTCVVVLRKNKKDSKIHFIDASSQFIRVDIKNKLSEKNRNKILNSIRNKTDEDFFSKYINHEEVANNDYNLSVNYYVKQDNQKEKINIIELNEKISNIVKKSNKLRVEIDKIITELEGQYVNVE